jgi:hypothetical protein
LGIDLRDAWIYAYCHVRELKEAKFLPLERDLGETLARARGFFPRLFVFRLRLRSDSRAQHRRFSPDLVASLLGPERPFPTPQFRKPLAFIASEITSLAGG